MKLKTLLAFTFAAAAVTFGTTAVQAADYYMEPTNVTIKVAGEPVYFPDQEPVIVNDRTLVPVRFIAESLGYNVEWDPIEDAAVIDNGRIIIYINSDRAILNGVETTLDVPSMLINDRTMIPLRVVAESLNCTVDWFDTNDMILINERYREELFPLCGYDKENDYAPIFETVVVENQEVSVFERFKQSDLFWYEKDVIGDEYLYWKADYSSLEEATDPHCFHHWWIEKNRTDDPQAIGCGLTGWRKDCTIVMQTFYPEDLAAVKDLLYTLYPTQYEEAYDYMLKSIKGQIWEANDPIIDPPNWLYSSAMRGKSSESGTYGLHYLDGREVRMLQTMNQTRFYVKVMDEGWVSPSIPGQLTEEKLAHRLEEARKGHCILESCFGLEW